MTWLEVTGLNEEAFGIFNISCGGVVWRANNSQGRFSKICPLIHPPKTLACGWGSMVLGELFLRGRHGYGQTLAAWWSVIMVWNERSVERRCAGCFGASRCFLWGKHKDLKTSTNTFFPLLFKIRIRIEF